MWFIQFVRDVWIIEKKGAVPSGKVTEIIKYLGTVSVDTTKYNFEENDSPKEWYVFYNGADSKVQEKLKGRASSVGLCMAKSSHDNYDGTTAKVSLFVR